MVLKSCICTLLHPHHTSVLGEILNRGWVHATLCSNLKVKLARHNEMLLSISMTSPMRCVPLSSLACFPLGFPFSFHWALWRLALLRAWSLKQFGLVWPWMPQRWQKCFTWDPLWFLGNDFPFALEFDTMAFFSTIGLSTLGFSTTFADTNFISLFGLALELPSPVQPNPVLSEKDFWNVSTLSSFLVVMRSTFAFTWITSSSRNLIFE